MNSKSSAILVFTRTKAEEAEFKTFYSRVGKKGNQHIAQLLINKSITTAKRTNLPVFTSFSPQQRGETFGERLANSIEDIFALGFEKVIAIGNDCPNLTTQSLLQVDQKLSKKDLVLGPAKDGGLYLIGLCSKVYCRSSFLSFSWKKNILAADWKIYAEQIQGSLEWLEYQSDLDESISFFQYLNSLSIFSFFGKKINSIIAGYQLLLISIEKIFQSFFYLNFSPLRAPPF